MVEDAGRVRGVLAAPVDGVDEAVGVVDDLVERVDNGLPAELGSCLQQAGDEEVGIDPADQRLFGHRAPVGRHPLVVSVAQRAVDLVLEGSEHQQGIVAVEQVARRRHELLVVRVRMQQRDLIPHTLALQLLGQSEHGVQVHAGGYEVDPGVDHLGHLGADAVGQAVGQVIVEVGDLHPLIRAVAIDRVGEGLGAHLGGLGDAVSEQRHPGRAGLRREPDEAADGACGASDHVIAEDVVAVDGVGTVDVPHEGRNPRVVEVAPPRRKERRLERGQAAVVGDDLQGVLLVAEQLVVEDLVDDEVAAVDAARVVDVVEIGLDPGYVAVEDAGAQRVVLLYAHDRDADLVVGHAGHPLEGHEGVALRVGVDRLLDSGLGARGLVRRGLAGAGRLRVRFRLGHLIGGGRLRVRLGLGRPIGGGRLGLRFRIRSGRQGRGGRDCVRCDGGSVAAGAVAAGRGQHGYGAEGCECASTSIHGSP